MITKRIGLAAVGLVAILLGGASLAWACTPDASLYSEPDYGPAGSTVTVHGAGFREAPVQIYWNSASGARLATAEGPNFSTQVTVPEATPGNHVIYAVSYGEDGAVAGSARSGFEVTGPDGQRARRPAGQEPQRPQARPTRRAPERVGGAERQSSPARQETSSARQTAPASRGRAVAEELEASRAVATSDEGRRVFAGSVAPSSRRERNPAPFAGARPFDAATRLSERTASGDVWSGVGASSGPSLVPSLTSAPVAERGSSLRIVGLGLVGVGLVALFAGLGLSGLRRRRAEAAPVDDRRAG